MNRLVQQLKRKCLGRFQCLVAVVGLVFSFAIISLPIRICSCACDDSLIGCCSTIGVASNAECGCCQTQETCFQNPNQPQPLAQTKSCCSDSLAESDDSKCDCCSDCECTEVLFLPPVDTKLDIPAAAFLPLARLAPIYEIKAERQAIKWDRFVPRASSLRLHALCSVWLN